MSTATLKALHSYDWPGNVRELENRVKRAVVMTDSAVLDPESLGLVSSEAPKDDSACEMKLIGTRYDLDKLTLKEARILVERDLLITILEREEGNVSRAAKSLGITRPTMYDLMKKHNIMPST